MIRRSLIGLTLLILIGATLLVLYRSFSPTIDPQAELAKSRLTPGFAYQSIDQYCAQYHLNCDPIERDSFTIVSDGLAYDHSSIYYLDQIFERREDGLIEQLHHDLIERYSTASHGPDRSRWDLDSFQILDLQYGYSRDQHHFYYAGLRVPDLDPAHIQILGNSLYSDGVAIYSGNEKTTINPRYFRFINADYSLDDQHLYYRTYLGFTTPIEGADPTTFQLLNQTFAKDAKQYYYNGIPLKEIDYDSFSPFKHYAVDHQRGYYFNNAMEVRLMPDVDYASFEEISPLYARDSEHLYYRGEAILNADPAKFFLNEEGFGVDDSGVYIGGLYLKVADPIHFQQIANTPYYHDHHALYYHNRLLNGADPKDFTFIVSQGELLGRSAQRCYRKATPIPCPTEIDHEIDPSLNINTESTVNQEHAL